MKTYIIIVVLALSMNCKAQTYISSAITTNSNWTVNGSPYIVTTAVALFSGDTLKIDPGVSVEFDNDASLTIKGYLSCIGTISDSITITSSSGSPFKGIWDGITIQNSQGGKADFQFCRGFYADALILISNSSPSDTIVKVMNSRFEENSNAVKNYDGISSYTLLVDSCSFKHNQIGIEYGDHIVVRNSTFGNNISYGIYCDHSDGYVNGCSFFGNSLGTNYAGLMDNCSITNNGTGIITWSTTIIKNSTISNNGVGLEFGTINTFPAGKIYNNYICENTSYNIKLDYGGDVIIPNNCWCTSDSTVIENSIYDAYDNGSLGVVTFSPFDTVCTVDVIQPISNFNSLLSCLPNPTSDITTIQFTLTRTSHVHLSVCDMSGREIETIMNDEFLYGTHSCPINFSSFARGVYVVRMITDFGTKNQKLIVE